MSERLEALQSKLPSEVLSLIRSFDSHPVSDLIREIEFEVLPGHVYAASGLILKNCNVWTPSAHELRRRLRHNRSLASHGGTWLPAFLDTKTWILSFPRWQFENVEDIGYLPLWVQEEYRLKVR